MSTTAYLEYWQQRQTGRVEGTNRHRYWLKAVQRIFRGLFMKFIIVYFSNRILEIIIGVLLYLSVK